LTIKSTSHTTRRYFLLRLHTCVDNAAFSSPRFPGAKIGTLPSFVCPSKYSVVKDRLVLKNSGDKGYLHIR
jgi:hypothetical protein